MLLTCAISILLVPAFAHAAAFEWSLPEPTAHAAPDNWSPAPTPAPLLSGASLSRRQISQGDNTCGFVSGSSQSSITCPNPSFICATNTLLGVHGCCDPSSLSACNIPTTCIPSSAMSTLCTDAFCSTNALVLKCTDAAIPDCYKWLIAYSRTTMTQHGCATQAFTSAAVRSWGVLSSSVIRESAASVASATSTLTSPPPPAPSSKSDLGIIIGSTIGGCTVVSLVALAICLVHRRRKPATHMPPVTRYHSAVAEYGHGVPVEVDAGEEHKAWGRGEVSRQGNVPQYPGMGGERYGVVEVDGVQRPVEAEADNVWHAREYTRD